MLIELKDIHKEYQSHGKGNVIFQNASLRVREGEFVSVVGKSGCGKSTLLNILGGMDLSYTGSYLFNGMDIRHADKKESRSFRSKEIGMIFQSFCLIKELNVMENVEMPMGYAGVSAKHRKEKALQLLELVNLADKAKCNPKILSGGERQRVAIARAMANDPEVVLADEPTGSLDEENGEIVLELLQKVNARGTTIIMVTHDMEIAGRAHRTILIKDADMAETKRSQN